MQTVNWALAAQGAEIAEVSHEATHVASSAANLLIDKEDLLWITGDAPQHVVLRLAPDHPTIKFVGWHVWHDYLTNPKTVEVASGTSPDSMTLLMVCHAQTGAGTQLWDLPVPVPASDTYVRLKITETFGPGPTYMNSIVLYANEPGPRFRSNERTSVALTRAPNVRSQSIGMRSAQRMTTLLKDLDDDIRALHPIKSVSPRKNMLLYVPQAPLTIMSAQEEEEAREIDEEYDQYDSEGAQYESRRSMTPQNRRISKQNSNSSQKRQSQSHEHLARESVAIPDETTRNFGARLNALEQAVASLTQSMVHQREDLALIKRLLLQQATDRRRDFQSSKQSGESLSGHGTTSTSSRTDTREGRELTAVASLLSMRPSSQHLSVEFPEDALRSVVDDILTPKLNKLSKRTEAKALRRLDGCMHDLVRDVTRVVDDRVQTYLSQVAMDVEHPYHHHFMYGLPNQSGASNVAPHGQTYLPEHPDSAPSQQRPPMQSYPETSNTQTAQRQSQPVSALDSARQMAHPYSKTSVGTGDGGGVGGETPIHPYVYRTRASAPSSSSLPHGNYHWASAQRADASQGGVPFSIARDSSTEYDVVSPLAHLVNQSMMSKSKSGSPSGNNNTANNINNNNNGNSAGGSNRGHGGSAPARPSFTPSNVPTGVSVTSIMRQ